MRFARALGLGPCLPLLGCAEPPPRTLELLVGGTEVDARAAVVTTTPPAARLSRLPDRLVLDFPAGTGAVLARVEGACSEVAPPDRAEVRLRPLFTITSPPRAAPGELVSFRAVPTCSEAQGASQGWSLEQGRWHGPESGEQTLTGTLPALEELLPEGAEEGPLAVSHRQSGRVTAVFRYRTRGGVSGAVRRSVVALPRHGGLLALATSGPHPLGGEGWRVHRSSAGVSALLSESGRRSWLTATGEGTVELLAPSGKLLEIAVGSYARVTLDCGRAECHGELATAVRRSPMHDTLARLLGSGHAGDRERARCGIACHAVGEPGVEDGGFAGTAATPWTLGSSWEELPASLRRRANVGCPACHGPAHLGPAGEAWRLARSSVCATCHDAPPRYGHVSALASSAHARSDAAPELRADPRCAACHTTAGFLARLEPRNETLERMAAAGAAASPSGIGCAACHDPHGGGDARGEPAPAGLLRSIPVPAALGRVAVPAESRACVACHSPMEEDGDEGPTSALVWAGAGTGVRPPHGDVPGGCFGCHRGGDETLQRGATHGFRLDLRACRTCHPLGAPEPSPRLAARFQEAVESLTREGLLTEQTDPRHSSRRVTERDPSRAALAREVSLLERDRGRLFHDPRRVLAAVGAWERTRDVKGGGR